MKKQSINSVGDSLVVLLVGDLKQEGITTKITSLGYRYQIKNLASSTDNWRSVAELVDGLRAEGKLIAVFLKLTQDVITRAAADDAYLKAWEEISAKLQDVKSLIFVYEDNLNGKFTGLTEDAQSNGGEQVTQLDIFGDETDPMMGGIAKENKIEKGIEFVNTLKEGPIEIAPYKKRTEITLRIQQYLDGVEAGIFLRFYVPNGRYQADQLATLLRLFESYLQGIEKLSFRIEARQTDHGVMYVFKSKEEVKDWAYFDGAYKRFESFMMLCQNDPNRAAAQLERMGTSPSQAVNLVTKYAKQHHRLKMDMRQETEQKEMALRHQFESEAFELSGRNVLCLSDSSISGDFRGLVNYSTAVSLPGHSHDQSAVDYINSLQERVLAGDIHYTEEDKKIRGLLDQYVPGLEAATLKSELDQLKDKSAPEEERITAKQKLGGFLHKVGQVARDEGIKEATKKLFQYLADLYPNLSS